MSRLITAETFFNPDGIMGIPANGTDIPVALWANYRFPCLEPVPPQGANASAVMGVPVFVNQGRWMVSCPFGCGSAQVASFTDRRFYCCGPLGCQNFRAGYQTIITLWPDPVTLAAIEDLLMLRPIMFRNWFPGEPLSQLQLENQANLQVVE